MDKRAELQLLLREPGCLYLAWLQILPILIAVCKSDSIVRANDKLAMSRSRIVSKSDVLLLHRPKSRRHPRINVRVSVEAGTLSVQSMEKGCIFFKPTVDNQHDLKVVWIDDMLDDDYSGVRNCFNVVTPEKSYILQASSNRVKIEWMQALSIAVSQTMRFRGSYRPSSWTNLDALQKWLRVREVQYRFQTHKQYKGAAYSGKWNSGMPHVRGSMRWPNGDRYDGEFMFGKFHGSGTMLWLSDKHMRSYTGRWMDGKMEERGEMVYADQSVYVGWWHLGKRHGHGRMEYKSNNSVYIGAWENDMRSGYGVYDNCTKSERYLGMWLNDKYHGPGILVSGDKSYYSGTFSNGEKSNLFGKTIVVRPGPLKSILEVDGTWIMKFDSSVASTVVQDDKWVPLFDSCSSLLQQMVSVCHSNPDICHTPSGDGEASGVPSVDFDDPDTIGVSPDMDSNCKTCNSTLGEAQECVACRVEGFKSADHPLGILVNNLTKCFLESYSGVGAHRNLLPHAIGELCSITVRLHQLVRKYCPSVITMDENHLIGRPRSQLSLMLKSKMRTPSTSSSQAVSTDPSWLYPILLPSIFPTLFAIYKEHHTESDDKLRTQMETLNALPDKELCSLLGLRREYQLWKKLRYDHTFSSQFGAAVEIFQNIGQFLTPLNKLLCVQEANGEITQICKTFTEDGRNSPTLYNTETQQLTSTGLLSLVIIRSQVGNLFSEIQFIQDFAGSTLLTEEYGFLLTQLKDCYYQIKDLERK